MHGPPLNLSVRREQGRKQGVPRNASPVKGNVEGSPLTDVATKGREGLDSSLLTSSPVASDPFPEAGVTQGYDDNRAEPFVVYSYGGPSSRDSYSLPKQEKPNFGNSSERQKIVYKMSYPDIATTALAEWEKHYDLSISDSSRLYILVANRPRGQYRLL